MTQLDGMRLMLEVEVDKSVERIRLSREIEKLTKELDKIKVKSNPLAFTIIH